MRTADSTFETTLQVLAVLLSIPVVMMVVAVPLMGLLGAGHGGGQVGAEMLVMPAIPIVLLVGIGYLLYTGVGATGSRETDDALEALRAEYARGELSTEEFEDRRERLRSTSTDDGTEVSGRE